MTVSFHRCLSLFFPSGRPKMCMLRRGRPHAFFFDGLEENRHYTVALDGVDNAETRTGAFTTLKARNETRNGGDAVNTNNSREKRLRRLCSPEVSLGSIFVVGPAIQAICAPGFCWTRCWTRSLLGATLARNQQGLRLRKSHAGRPTVVRLLYLFDISFIKKHLIPWPCQMKSRVSDYDPTSPCIRETRKNKHASLFRHGRIVEKHLRGVPSSALRRQAAPQQRAGSWVTPKRTAATLKAKAARSICACCLSAG